MPTYEFPFIQQDETSPFKPLLPLWIYNSHDDFGGRTRIWGLIDTGADQSIIPEYSARVIDHFMDHEDVKTDRLDGIGGGVKVWFHTFNIKICSVELIDGNIEVDDNNILIDVPDIKLAVVPAESYHGDAILGVNDFLKDYVLTIDYPRQTFSLTR